MRRAKQEPIILHENVPEFDVKLLHSLLGELYHIESEVLDVSAYGWPVTRFRRWTVLIHKVDAKAVLEHSVLRTQRWHWQLSMISIATANNNADSNWHDTGNQWS